jgi:post-segregation antitoxin (ccd killing protein)
MGIEIEPPVRLRSQIFQRGIIRRKVEELRKRWRGRSAQVALPPGVTMEEAIRVTAESPWAKGWAEGIARLAGYVPGTREYDEQVKRLSHFVAERLWRG